MTKKNATKAEREHMTRVAGLGCVICGDVAQVHHITGAGMGLRASHYDTYPLCLLHHTGSEGIHTIGIKTWQARFGYEREFLAQTKQVLE